MLEDNIRIAAAAYPLTWLDDWQAFEAKLTGWVAGAAGNGAQILVFPEYGSLELASLAGRDVAGDLQASIDAVSDRVADADALHAKLAQQHGIHICAASATVRSNLYERPVNRARLFSPDGRMGVQDKLIMTRFEREEWDIAPGSEVRVFDTCLGKIGIVICYDSEFPLIARAMVDAGAQILLCPSVTESFAGYTRVKTGSMARALENQCVVAHAPLVGEADWTEAADVSVGAAGIYGPSDTGFPETGILAMGGLNEPGWVYADFTLAQIEAVRREGTVFNHAHWTEQDDRLAKAEIVSLA